jgi:hypothetical protein
MLQRYLTGTVPSWPDAARLEAADNALLTLASRPRGSAEADKLGRQQRRQRQHLALVRRLLDPLPVSLRAGGHAAELFWRVVRFGGAGMLLAWWLMR